LKAGSAPRFRSAASPLPFRLRAKPAPKDLHVRCAKRRVGTMCHMQGKGRRANRHSNARCTKDNGHHRGVQLPADNGQLCSVTADSATTGLDGRHTADGQIDQVFAARTDAERTDRKGRGGAGAAPNR
jgi:hypothetical protein